VDANRDILERLMAVIESRKQAPAEKSYTASLLRGGVDAIGAKVIEEAGEVVAAAREPGESGHAHLVHEAADVIYHLFVLMAHGGATLAEVEGELARRFGISGHDEKASR